MVRSTKTETTTEPHRKSNMDDGPSSLLVVISIVWCSKVCSFIYLLLFHMSRCTFMSFCCIS